MNIRMLKIICIFTLLTAVFSAQSTFAAGSKILTLNVTGTITPAPEWRDEQGLELTSLNLSFDGLVANTSPDVAIESRGQTARLLNAARYPAEIIFQRPSGCRIGTTIIRDEHVELVFDHALASRSGVLSITSDQSKIISLQFSKAGQYGQAFGPVSCNQSGALVYGY